MADRRWIMFPQPHGLSDLINVVCAGAGFTPRAAVLTEQVEAAVRLAAAGVGIALVPCNTVPADLADHVRRLARPIVRELTAYTRGTWPRSAQPFLAALRDQGWQSLPRDAVTVP